MSRYIDAEALYKVVTEKYHDICAGSYPYNIVAYDMAQLVKNAPTADVVEVVRCKDCKEGEVCPDTLLWCNQFERLVPPKGFCHCGERREG